MPSGWVLFRALVGAFSVSCLLALMTVVVERHVRETLDAVMQSALLRSLEALDDPCPESRTALPCVTQVLIGPSDHDELFGRSSPLDPNVLARFVEAVVEQADQGQAPGMLVFDLDLAPISVADGMRRERLITALLRLSDSTPVLLVCPQSYYHGEATPEEQLFVQSLIERSATAPGSRGGIRFAGAVIDSNGLYYDQERSPLGAVAARWWNQRNAREGRPLPPPNPCRDESIVSEGERDKPIMIVPSHIETVSFSVAADNAELLAQRIAIVGGTYGTEDVYRFRSVLEPYFGVTLHAWILKDELEPQREPGNLFRALLDVAVGLVSGFLFAWLWSGAHAKAGTYATRSLYYTGFLLAVLTFPVLILYMSLQSLVFGVSMGTAGMVISGMFDALQRKSGDDEPPAPQAPMMAATALIILGTLVLFYRVDSKSELAVAGLWTAAAAWALCHVHRNGLTWQRASHGVPATGWIDCWRADLREAGLKDSSRSDKCMAAATVVVLGAAVLCHTTNQLAPRLEDWAWQPVLLIILFGAVCRFFDHWSRPTGH